MGYSKTPKHVALLNYVDFSQKRKATLTVAWNQRGKITDNAAKRYLDSMNKSIEPGGSNEHLAANQSYYSSIRVVLNDGTDKNVVAYYTKPTFEVI